MRAAAGIPIQHPPATSTTRQPASTRRSSAPHGACSVGEHIIRETKTQEMAAGIKYAGLDASNRDEAAPSKAARSHTLHTIVSSGTQRRMNDAGLCSYSATPLRIRIHGIHVAHLRASPGAQSLPSWTFRSMLTARSGGHGVCACLRARVGHIHASGLLE